MISKNELKKKAILLRKNGLSYTEVLKEVPVAKSTLSLWLREVGLSLKQTQRLSEKKLNSARKGALIRKQTCAEKTKSLHEKSAKEIGKLSEREKFLIGVALYWAEGTKEKTYRIGARVDFSNSDPKMIQFFLVWLRESCGVEKEEILIGLYIHENNKPRLKEIIQHWSNVTKIPIEKFRYVYFKKHNPKTVRKNTGDTYFGTVKISVRKSVDLNRKIAGWIQGLCK